MPRKLDRQFNPHSDQGLPSVTLLERLRIERGLSQRALVARSGLSEGTVRALEAGRTANPHAPTIHALAGALELEPLELARLFREEQAAPEPESEEAAA